MLRARCFRSLLTLVVVSGAAFAQSAPENLGLGLRELVDAYRAHRISPSDLRTHHLVLDAGGPRLAPRGPRSHVVIDHRNRLLTKILLDGSVPIDQLSSDLGKLGADTIAADPTYRRGALEVFLPLEAAERVARMPGVSAVILGHRPMHRVGSVTSQGVAALHADQVQSKGITGKGITVGLISDSWNMSDQPVTSAYDDVASGDLPNLGVADGRPGLKFMIEPSDFFVLLGLLNGFTDEGRAMGQVVYDMAPSVSLCFATSLGEVSTAANIRRMRTDSQCAADIIVDDFQDQFEPFFSDSMIGNAINDVATSTTLAGKKVAYFSAAGNDAGQSYFSDLRFIADADARALTDQAVDLSKIQASIDTSGGFHNFNPDPNGPPIISQAINLLGASRNTQFTLIVQWDDPFDLKPSGITTDLNVMVYSSTGTYLGAMNANNFQTNEPIEAATLIGSGFRIVIARTGSGSQLATKVGWITDFPQESITGDFLGPGGPALFGHTAARGAIAVGAYLVDNRQSSGKFTPELEDFSSAGPVTITMDQNGQRLGTPEIRQKPEISAVDGVETTFFGDPNLADPFFTFGGTSAAVPHAAGIAALMLDAAGGPGSLAPDQIRSRLIASTAPHDLDPDYSQAVLGDGSTVIKVTCRGAESPVALTSSKFFTVEFSSPNSAATLDSLSIDLSTTSLFFNTNRLTGFPVTISPQSSGPQATSQLSGAGNTALTLSFTGFQAGGALQFGVGRALLTNRLVGFSADLLGGATVTASVGGTKYTGTIVNQFGTGYTPRDGYGLIDAVKAVAAQ